MLSELKKLGLRPPLIWRLLLIGGLLFFSCALSLPASAVADRLEESPDAPMETVMPESGKADLKSVLAQPEFQPRHSHQRWTFDLQGMLLTVWEHFARWVKDHLGELHLNLPQPTFLQPVADVFIWLGGALLTILDFFATYWWVFALLALFYFSARFWWRRRPRIDANLDRALQPFAQPVELVTWEKLQDLLKTGQLEQLVVQLRAWFRSLSKQEFQSPLSATDRETLARIPRSQTERDCFLRIVRAFERYAFASESPNGVEIEKILGDAEPLLRSGRIAKRGS